MVGWWGLDGSEDLDGPGEGDEMLMVLTNRTDAFGLDARQAVRRRRKLGYHRGLGVKSFFLQIHKSWGRIQVNLPVQCCR